MKRIISKIRTRCKPYIFGAVYILLLSCLSTVLYTGWLPLDKIVSYKIYPQNRPELDLNILDSLVVLAPGEDLGRAEITKILNQLPKYSPKAVFMDFFFPYEEEGDSALIAAIKKIPNMIMCVAIDNNPEAVERMPLEANTYFLQSLDSCSNIHWGNSLFRSYYDIENKVEPSLKWDGKKIKPAGIILAELFAGKECPWKYPQFINFDPVKSIRNNMIDHLSPNINLKGKVVFITDKTIADIHDTPIGPIFGCYTHFAVCYQTIKSINDDEIELWWLPVIGISLIGTILFIGAIICICRWLPESSFSGLIKQSLLLLIAIGLNLLVIYYLRLDPKWIYLFFTISTINILFFPLFDSYKYGTELYTYKKN